MKSSAFLLSKFQAVLLIQSHYTNDTTIIQESIAIYGLKYLKIWAKHGMVQADT